MDAKQKPAVARGSIARGTEPSPRLGSPRVVSPAAKAPVSSTFVVQQRPSSAKPTSPAPVAQAFGNLSNAVLQLFDRTFDTSHMQPDERASVNEQIKVRAAEVVETLKIHVRDELDFIQKTELGALKARERQLMGDVAAEQQQSRDLSFQLQALKEAMEEIKKMHAAEMSQRQGEYGKHFAEEMAQVKTDHTAEIKHMKAVLALAGQTASNIGGQVDQLKAHYQASENFHAAQVGKLQAEIDAERAAGKHKEADARLAYLSYHQAELQKIRGVINIAGGTAANLEDAVNSLKEHYSTELEAAKAAYEARLAEQRAAIRAEYEEELEKLRRQLAASQGELVDRDSRLETANRGVKHLEALKGEHAAAVAKLKEAHREEMYLLQAKQAKLQKELSLRLDPLKLSSQDSINSSPSATIKRRLESSMGRTGPRRMPNAGAHKKVGFRDPDADEDMEDEAPEALDPFAAKQAALRQQLKDIDQHYEVMQSKRGRLEDYNE